MPCPVYTTGGVCRLLPGRATPAQKPRRTGGHVTSRHALQPAARRAGAWGAGARTRWSSTDSCAPASSSSAAARRWPQYSARCRPVLAHRNSGLGFRVGMSTRRWPSAWPRTCRLGRRQPMGATAGKLLQGSARGGLVPRSVSAQKPRQLCRQGDDQKTVQAAALHSPMLSSAIRLGLCSVVPNAQTPAAGPPGLRLLAAPPTAGQAHTGRQPSRRASRPSLWSALPTPRALTKRQARTSQTRRPAGPRRRPSPAGARWPAGGCATPESAIQRITYSRTRDVTIISALLRLQNSTIGTSSGPK